MNITLNGKQKKISPDANPVTLKSLIEQFVKDTTHIIAEINGTIVSQQQWDKKRIHDGDTIEIVAFVGGG